MNFIQLCEEVGKWSSKQKFGGQPPDNPLLGILEEIGELSHSVLKMAQGIRGTRQEHIAKIEDAIADAVIFLADFCYRADIVQSFVGREMLQGAMADFHKFSLLSIHKKFSRWYIFHAANNATRLAYCFYEGEDISWGIYVENVLLDLFHFCELEKFDFVECVEKTWLEVRQRDWNKNELTGAV